MKNLVKLTKKAFNGATLAIFNGHISNGHWCIARSMVSNQAEFPIGLPMWSGIKDVNLDPATDLTRYFVGAVSGARYALSRVVLTVDDDDYSVFVAPDQEPVLLDRAYVQFFGLTEIFTNGPGFPCCNADGTFTVMPLGLGSKALKLLYEDFVATSKAIEMLLTVN